MNLDFLKGILLFVVLLLVQALVLNHIHLFGVATPLLYVYIVLLFRRNYPRWAILVWCFVMGLGVDIFSNTPGVAAASMTLMGLLQPFLLLPFINRDTPDDLLPSIRTLGLGKFASYTLIVVFIYCLVFFTLETFNFFNWLLWFEYVGASTVLTTVLVLVIDNLRN